MSWRTRGSAAAAAFGRGAAAAGGGGGVEDAAIAQRAAEAQQKANKLKKAIEQTKGGNVQWTGGGAAAGGAAAAGGGGAAPAASLAERTHEGAMIFIIDPHGYVLCGQEGPFADERRGKTSMFIQSDLPLPLTRDTILQLAGEMKTKFGYGIGNPTRIPLDFEEKLPTSSWVKANPVTSVNHHWFSTQPRTTPARGKAYGVPKGGNKPNENAFDTINREVWEEVGIDLESLPNGRLQYNGIIKVDFEDPQGVITTKNSALFYLQVDEDEKLQIEQIINKRTVQKYGEVFNLAFLDLSTLTLNNATRLGRAEIQKLLPPPALRGGRRRRITRKRTKRSKRSMKKTSRRTRRR